MLIKYYLLLINNFIFNLSSSEKIGAVAVEHTSRQQCQLQSTINTIFSALLNFFLITRPCAEAVEELSSFSSFCYSKTCNPSPTFCLCRGSVYMLPVYAR